MITAKPAKSEAEKRQILERALLKMKQIGNRPLVIKTDLGMASSIISQLQLAMRHPENTGITRQTVEKFTRDLIEQIDPDRGDLYELLMMGFNPDYDE